MTIVVLSNPKNFVIEAQSKNIRYEYLMESIICNGIQKTARYFVGRSSRGEHGTLSASTLLNWIATFEYVLQNKDKDDNDPYQARHIEKRGNDWDKFVELIKKPIDDEEIKSWENLSYKKLGDKALEIGLTIGIRRQNVLPQLLSKLKETVERRKQNIWDKPIENISINKNDYRLKNVFELRDLCKQRNIVQCHKTKDEMIRDLENFDKNKDEHPILNKYENMTLKELKNLAKDRIIAGYNKLNTNALINIHKKYDEEMKKMKENQNKEIVNDDQNNNIEHNNDKITEFILNLSDNKAFTIPFRQGKNIMINATVLCKAGNKKFHDYIRLKTTQEFLQTLESVEGIPSTNIINIIQGGDFKNQGSYVHQLVAIDLARWISPQFSVQISKWVHELMMTGKVELQRPLKFLIDLKEIDIEAEKLELENQFIHTNTNVLYIAYIGDSLVKIGFSTNYLKRENKHLSTTETEYQQFRILKIFEISSQNIETQIHNLLDRYRVSYNRQKEIYRPPSTLIDFINHIEILLQETDLHLQIQKLKVENLELKNKLLEMEKENLELHNRLEKLQTLV